MDIIYCSNSNHGVYNSSTSRMLFIFIWGSTNTGYVNWILHFGLFKTKTVLFNALVGTLDRKLFNARRVMWCSPTEQNKVGVMQVKQLLMLHGATGKACMFGEGVGGWSSPVSIWSWKRERYPAMCESGEGRTQRYCRGITFFTSTFFSDYMSNSRSRKCYVTLLRMDLL